jgi:hypothetical protein
MSPESVDLEQFANAVAERLSERLSITQQRLLDRAQLAERLGVSERGVTSLASRGELPAGYLIGGVRRWRWEEVLRFLASREKRRPRQGRGRYERRMSAGEKPAVG